MCTRRSGGRGREKGGNAAPGKEEMRVLHDYSAAVGRTRGVIRSMMQIVMMPPLLLPYKSSAALPPSFPSFPSVTSFPSFPSVTSPSPWS